MPLDATKVHNLILAHAAAHLDSDDCEFCQFCRELAQDERFLKCISINAVALVLSAESLEQFFLDAFTSGFIVGVKLERTRVMEEEFKL